MSAVHAVTARQGHLKLNPNRPTAGHRAQRDAWRWAQVGPDPAFVEIHQTDGTIAVVDTLSSPEPLPGFSERWQVEHRLLLDAAENRWATRPQWWLHRWRRALDDLQPVVTEIARQHRVDPAHVVTVAQTVAAFSSKQGKPVWPKVERIRSRASAEGRVVLSRRTVFRCLAVLRSVGFVETIGQIVVRSDIDPGGLVGGPAVRLLTMPTRVLDALRHAHREMIDNETERRRAARLLNQTPVDHTAPVVAQILGQRAATSPDPPAPEVPVAAPEKPAEASAAAQGLAAARAALAAARGG